MVPVAQACGWISFPHVPAWQVAGPVESSHATVFAHVVPHEVVRLRSTSQPFDGSLSQFLVPEAHGTHVPTMQVWVCAAQGTAVPQSPCGGAGSARRSPCTAFGLGTQIPAPHVWPGVARRCGVDARRRERCRPFAPAAAPSCQPSLSFRAAFPSCHHLRQRCRRCRPLLHQPAVRRASPFGAHHHASSAGRAVAVPVAVPAPPVTEALKSLVAGS